MAMLRAAKMIKLHDNPDFFLKLSIEPKENHEANFFS